MTVVARPLGMLGILKSFARPLSVTLVIRKVLVKPNELKHHYPLLMTTVSYRWVREVEIRIGPELTPRGLSQTVYPAQK